MSSWKILLFGLLVVVVAANEAEPENKPSSDINIVESGVKTRLGVGVVTRCLSWDCRRREMTRKKSTMGVARSVNPFSPEEEQGEEVGWVKCLSGDCKREVQSVPQLGDPQVSQQDVNSDEVPCLTSDCRAGKRSLERDSKNEDDTALENKLQLRNHSLKRRSSLACIVWHCNG